MSIGCTAEGEIPEVPEKAGFLGSRMAVTVFGDGDAAISLMDEAIELALSQRLPNGAANPIKPPYELYGEILLGLGKSEEAREKFEASLLRMPKRTHSLLGAAEAAAASGDSSAARQHYATLLEFWQGSPGHPGIREATRFTSDGQEE